MQMTCCIRRQQRVSNDTQQLSCLDHEAAEQGEVLKDNALKHQYMTPQVQIALRPLESSGAAGIQPGGLHEAAAHVTERQQQENCKNASTVHTTALTPAHWV
mmetsp:Transcript_75969/g.126482  ORF Transcript_75969/g.126482 Transcript_75969/m.126482 type:complete len:102 (-) Transcript_75969:17-322(-)